MARIPLGQNTPLTLIGVFTGESGTSQSRDGITTTAPSATYITGGLQHLRDGAGGSYALRLTTSNGVIFPFGTVIVREAILAFPLFGERNTSINFLRGGSEYQGGLELNEGNAIRFIRGESGASPTTLALGTTGYIPEDLYSWCCMRYFVDNSTGLIQLRVHAYANLHLSFSGDTQASGTFANVDGVRFYMAGVANDGRLDDFYAFARTLYYSGGSGTIPAAGDLITDGTTGATCRVDFVEGTNVTGVLVVYSVTDGASFGSGNTISNGGGWSATADNALGNDQAGLWVNEVFGMAGALSSDITADWTGATGGGAHYTQVNDWVDTATYVFSDTAGQVDEYGTTAPSIPAGTPIVGLIISAWAQNNGSPTVTHVSLGYDSGGTNEDGPEQVMPSNYARVDTYWSYNPITGSAFTLLEINNLAARMTSEA